MDGLIAKAKEGHLELADIKAELGDKEGLEDNSVVWMAVREALREAQQSHSLQDLVTTAKTQVQLVNTIKKNVAAGKEVSKTDFNKAGTLLVDSDEPKGGMQTIYEAIKRAGDEIQTPIQLRNVVYELFGWEVAKVTITLGLTEAIPLLGKHITLLKNKGNVTLELIRPFSKSKNLAVSTTEEKTKEKHVSKVSKISKVSKVSKVSKISKVSKVSKEKRTKSWKSASAEKTKQQPTEEGKSNVIADLGIRFGSKQLLRARLWI